MGIGPDHETVRLEIRGDFRIEDTSSSMDVPSIEPVA